MFPPLPAPPTGKRSGFTLLELLVVIAIISVLAGILLPVIGNVQNRARKVQCINDMQNVKTAMVAYYGDYRKYPLTTTQAPDGAAVTDQVYGDPGGTYGNFYLFDILRAVSDAGNLNNARNLSQQVYWPGSFAKNAAAPREGITVQPVTVNGQTIPAGSLVDPWGNQYIVWIDGDQDGDLSVIINQFYTDVSTTPGTVHPGLPPMGVAFGSLGADGMAGAKGNKRLTGSDDVVTWQ